MKPRIEHAISTLSGTRKSHPDQGNSSPRTASETSSTPAEEPNLSPAPICMLLKDEIGRKASNPPWALVEKVIRELDPGRFNSYASLKVPGGTYLQCLRGYNGWHLEWRITHPSGEYVHFRACYSGGSEKPFELKKHDYVSDGEFRDLINTEEVVDSFRSFHQGLGLPDFMEWRKLTI